MSTKRTAVTTDSDGSIHKEPDIKLLAEKSLAKKEGKRLKRLKIHHRSSRDDGDGKDRKEDGRRSHSKIRSRSRSRSENKIQVQSPRDKDSKDVDNGRFNDNSEQSKVDEENMNERERKLKIEKKDDDNDQNTKSVKSRERKVTKKSGDRNKKEIPEYIKVISQDRNDIKYFPKSGIQYTKSEPVVMYCRNLAADTTSHVQSRQQMLETSLNVEVIPDKYHLEVKPNDLEENSGADKSTNVCDTMNVQRPNNFKCKKKNKSEGVLKKVHEKNCTSTSNISNKFDDCVNIDKSLRLNNGTLCPLNAEENKSGAQELPDMFVKKHVGQNEKPEQLEAAVDIIRNIDEFMANKFTDKKLGTLVKTEINEGKNYTNDFRQLRSIQDKNERQNFYVNHCLTANLNSHILETNSNTSQYCTQLLPKCELASPTCTNSMVITPTGGKKEEEESALSTVASNIENDSEIIEEEIAALSDSELHFDSDIPALRRDNSNVGMESPDREDDTESILFSSLSSYDFRNIDLDEQSTLSDLSEPWVEENNHSAQLVLQDTTVGLLYNVHNNSNIVLDIEIQNQPNGTPMNNVNDRTEYYYYLRNQPDGNGNYYYYYQSYGPENYYDYVRGLSYAYDHNYYYYHQPSAPENYYDHYYADNSSNVYGNYYHQPSVPQNHYDHYANNSSNEYNNYYHQPSAPQNHYDHHYVNNSSNEYNNYYHQPSAPQNPYNHYYANNSSNEYSNYYYQPSAPQNHYDHYYEDNSSNGYNYYHQTSAPQNHYDHYSGDLSNGQYNSTYSESFESVVNGVQENALDYSSLRSVNTIPVLEFNGIPSIAVTQVEDEFRTYSPPYVTVQNDHAEFSNENSTSVDQLARVVEDQISYRNEQHNENSRTNFNIDIVTESSSSSYRSSSSSSYRSSSSSEISSSSYVSNSSDSSTVSSEPMPVSQGIESNAADDQESLSLPLMVIHHPSCCEVEVPSDDESIVFISCPCVNESWTNKPHAIVRPFQKDSETDSDESSQS